MKRTRIATAALMTRGEGDRAEILVVRRSQKLRFFGGYWAFPGGVIDAADHDGDEDHDEAHVRCALRELYEEVGLVLPLMEPIEDGLRDRLLERGNEEAPRRFRTLLEAAREESGHGGGDPLEELGVVPIARLTTPPFAPVLYRTRFVHLTAPSGFEPDIIEGELVDGEFARPLEILESWRRGERLVAPPVVFMLEHIAELGLERFLKEIPALAESLEAGKLHPIRNVPGIIMAPLATKTLPPATTTNAYIVGESRLFVVDPAPTDEREQQRLFDLLDERIALGAEFVGVLLTHHHPDHVGAVEQTAKRYDVPVLAHEATLALLDLSVTNTRALPDGVELPLGDAPDGQSDWKLVAHFTPGHAPGHLAFRESRYGAVIAGDLISTVSTIVIDPPEGHLATYVRSLEAMRDLMGGAGVLHPAHGPVAANGPRVLERYLEHRQRREDSLVEALGDGLSAEADLVRRVYADVDERMYPIAGRSLRAGLEKLAEESRAEATGPASWRAL